MTVYDMVFKCIAGKTSCCAKMTFSTEFFALWTVFFMHFDLFWDDFHQIAPKAEMVTVLFMAMKEKVLYSIKYFLTKLAGIF
jgi:hypothetical protein